MEFEFAAPGRIVFGPGCSERVPELAASFGRRVLVTLDSDERAAPLLEGLAGRGLSVATFRVESEPTVALVELATRIARDFGAELVVGLGGGSALDTAKAAAALSANPGEPLDYLEVVGRGRPLERSALPLLAIPTTAGTGSEATRNAVLSVPERRLKVSLRSPFLLPRLAIVDPLLCLSLPPGLTAATGLDALTQLIEPFVCNAPHPFADALCRQAIPGLVRALPAAVRDPQDRDARQALSFGSLCSGLALANARLGAVHGLAAVLGGWTSAPHGAICARLLPLVFAANLEALRSSRPDSPCLPRFDEVARLLTGSPEARAEDGLPVLQALVDTLPVPPLDLSGLRPEDLPAIAAQAQASSSMKGNPLPLTEVELLAILHAAG